MGIEFIYIVDHLLKKMSSYQRNRKAGILVVKIMHGKPCIDLNILRYHTERIIKHLILRQSDRMSQKTFLRSPELRFFLIGSECIIEFELRWNIPVKSDHLVYLFKNAFHRKTSLYSCL